jgi:hypothetical protein
MTVDSNVLGGARRPDSRVYSLSPRIDEGEERGTVTEKGGGREGGGGGEVQGGGMEVLSPGRCEKGEVKRS